MPTRIHSLSDRISQVHWATRLSRRRSGNGQSPLLSLAGSLVGTQSRPRRLWLYQSLCAIATLIAHRGVFATFSESKRLLKGGTFSSRQPARAALNVTPFGCQSSGSRRPVDVMRGSVRSLQRRSWRSVNRCWKGESACGPERPSWPSVSPDADNWLKAVQGDLVRGVYIDAAGARVLFEDYAEQWRNAEVHRPSTALLVESHMRLHVYPTFGARQLGSIRPSEILG